MDTKEKNFWHRLTQLSRTIVSPDSDKFIYEIGQHYPIETRQYNSGERYGTWSIPDSWSLKTASIEGEGVSLNSEDYPLLVQPYSNSIDCKISKSELTDHVKFDKARPNEFIYYSKLAYQYPKNRDWMLSIPYNTWKSLTETEYTVKIESNCEPGSMKVATLDIQGGSDKTVVFVAHYCHPYQFDDGLGGVYTLLKIYDRLKLKKNNLSYRFIFVPETIGSVAYLSDLSSVEKEKMIGGFFIEAPGKTVPLSVKQPFNIENAFSKVILHDVKKKGLKIKGFRESVSNDELVFGDADHNIPVFSYQRWPYKEYHTTLDSVNNFDSGAFEETLKNLLDVIFLLENNYAIKRTFNGPLYMYGFDLHTPLANDRQRHELDWGFMQATGLGMTVAEMSEHLNVDYSVILKYMNVYLEKGLIKIDLEKSFE